MRKEEERRVRVSFCMFLKKRGENYKNRSENNNLNVLFLDCLGIMEVWWIMCKWQVEYVLNCEITCVLRCCVHWVVSYKSYNHTTVRSFKSDELMRDKYYDRIHCGNPTSLITLRYDELKLFWKQLRSRVFCTVHR